jgi:hypothetical protein
MANLENIVSKFNNRDKRNMIRKIFLKYHRQKMYYLRLNKNFSVDPWKCITGKDSTINHRSHCCDPHCKQPWKEICKRSWKGFFSYSKLNSGTISFVFSKGQVYKSRIGYQTPYLIYLGRFSHLHPINLLILLRFPWATRWFGKYQETPS